MQPYRRHVTAPFLVFPGLNIVLDENRAVIRYLGYSDKLPTKSEADLLVTDELCPRFHSEENQVIYGVKGRAFRIIEETILDKRDVTYAYNWVPGTHFVFHFDSTGGHVDPKGSLSAYLKCTTADLIRKLGGVWYFDIWVRDHHAPVSACATSLTTAKDTILVTNIEDLGEEWAASDVMKGGRSKWLNLDYELVPRTNEIAPDESVDYLFRVLDGKTGEVATDVTWDGFEIEAVDGYVPHRRLSVVNGIGTFSAYALHLNHGDLMRVKINRRYQSSVAEASVSIK